MSMLAAGESTFEEVDGLRQALADVRASFYSEDRFLPDRDAVHLSCSAGSLILEGDVHDVAVKRLLVARAASHPDVASIVDRVRVAPSRRMGERQILAAVREALLAEPLFSAIRVEETYGESAETIDRPSAPSDGEVAIRAQGGVVFLEGVVPSLLHKRLAGVFAWWVPGCRDVVNLLRSQSSEADSDEEITRAVRTALDKDPAILSTRIQVETNGGVALLRGVVTTSRERLIAERDAWYVLGVTGVANDLSTSAVHRHPARRR